MSSPSHDERLVSLALAATDALDVRATRRPRSVELAGTLDATEARSLPAPLPRVAIDVPEPGVAFVPSGDADLAVRELLAEGGMGRLFVAEQRSLAREVVVKTVRDRTDGAQIRALVAEATITGSLEHPNITPVHLAGEDARGSPVLVMKRIVGVSWSALLEGDADAWDRMSALSRDRFRAHLEILGHVATAIHFAHERGVVHRDIKPDNVMVGSLGEVYVVDWGIALRPRRGEGPPRELVGTPCFAAPEMLGAGEIGPHTDVYLLGATLHFVLTGHYRHEGETGAEVLAKAAESAPYAYEASVPAELALLANAATSRDPSKRPPSALVFRRALGDYLEHAASERLATEGFARVNELVALRRSAAPDPVVSARLLAEARFAFHSAAAAWPESPRAHEGRTACVREAIEIEIARGNVAAARALVVELASTPSDIEARLAALEAAEHERAADAARLKRHDHDEDVGLAARDRVYLLAALSLVSVGVGVPLLARAPGALARGDGGKLVALAVLVLAVTLAGGVVVRRRVLVNKVNRRLYAALVGAVAMVVVHRALDWAADAEPSGTVRTDMLLLAMPCFAVATFVRARVWLAGALAVGCAVLATAFPRATVHLFSVASFGTVVALAVALRSSTARNPR